MPISLKEVNITDDLHLPVTGFKSIDGADVQIGAIHNDRTTTVVAVNTRLMPALRNIGHSMRFLPNARFQTLKWQITEVQDHIKIMANHEDPRAERLHREDFEHKDAFTDFMDNGSAQRLYSGSRQREYDPLEDALRTKITFIHPSFFDRTIGSIRQTLQSSNDEERELIKARLVRHSGWFWFRDSWTKEQAMNQFDACAQNLRGYERADFAASYTTKATSFVLEEAAIAINDRPTILNQINTTVLPRRAFSPSVIHIGNPKPGFLDLWGNEFQDKPKPDDYDSIAHFDLGKLNEVTGTYPFARIVDTTTPDWVKPNTRAAVVWTINPDGTRNLETQDRFEQIKPQLNLPNPQQADVYAGVPWISLLMDKLPQLYDHKGDVYLEGSTFGFEQRIPQTIVMLHAKSLAPWIFQNPFFTAVERNLGLS
jgi:hypothetical protein